MDKEHLGRQVLSLPPVGALLREADMRQDAAGELVRQLVKRGGTEIVGGDERKDGRPRICCPVHVANVNFRERGFANR